MNAVIISIGNELLSGHENTNASWLAKEFTGNGITTVQILTVPDDKKAISKALETSFANADIVVSTGGLGPTVDDITKNVLCKFFDCGIVFSESTYKNIEKLFKLRGFPVTPSNKRQAEVPDKAVIIPNLLGTAPGLWFDKEGKSFVAMPGVPYEMKAMFSDFVIPELKKRHKLPVIVSKTVLTQGIGESFLSEKISDWESSIPSQISLAYLPSPGIVRVRLTATDEDKEAAEVKIDNLVASLRQIIPEYIYGYDNQKLEDIIASLLLQRNASVATAESCTGGYLSHLITSRPGSSAYYKGGFIAYSNEVKIKQLGVPKKLIEAHGAVSSEVVLAMAQHVRKKMGATYGIGITGIAGPSGGSEYKPVGTVWIAVSSEAGAVSQMFLFGDNRAVNITKSAISALHMLKKEIEK